MTKWTSLSSLPMRSRGRAGRQRTLVFPLIALMFAGTMMWVVHPRPSDADASRPLRQARMQPPMAFEPNHGQLAEDERFLARGAGFAVGFSVAGARLQFAGDDGPWQITLSPVESEAVALTAERPLPGHVNYLIGNDPGKWHRDVPTFERVRYEGIHSGIDLVFYGNQGRLEYDYIVAPGADPSRILMHVGGADALSLDASGNLLISRAAQTVTQLKPTIYQVINGGRREVTGRYTLHGSNRIGFAIDAYDATEALVIDPILTFSTYLGHGVTYARGVTVDSAGFVYVTGSTTNPNFPLVGGLPGGYRGGNGDGFVVKMSPDGQSVIWSTFIGGSFGGASGYGGQDFGHRLVVDALGQAHLIGSTFSRDFPVVNPFQATTPTDPTIDGQMDVFVTKLTPAGNDIVFSTYLGGVLGETPGDIAIDAAGNTYVLGDTNSTDFPVLSALQPTKKSANDETKVFKRSDLFVTKLSPTGVGLFSTYLGGLGSDVAAAAGVDSSGNVVITGNGGSSDYPIVNPLPAWACGLRSAGYLTKLNPAGTEALYSTCFPGVIKDIAIDSSNAIYVAGNQDLPGYLPTTVGAYQTTFGGGAYDMFAVKLTPNGSAYDYAYATYIGRTDDEHVFGLGIDGAGAAYLVGDAFGPNFPIVNAVQPVAGRVAYPSVEAVVVKVAPNGKSLDYSTFLGGDSPYGEQAWEVAVDDAGNAFVVGWTDGGSFPITPGVIQPTQSGRSGFVSRISPGGNSGCTPSFQTGGTSVGANGGPLSLRVLALASDCTWTVSGAPSWLIPTSNTSGMAIGAVAYTASFNGGPSRTATLTLNGGATFTVQQQGTTACSFSFSPAGAIATSAGGNGTTQLTATAGCAWAATSNAPWLTFTGSSIGTGTATLGYGVAANTSTSARSATITAGGATFTVQQAGMAVSTTPPPSNLAGTTSGNNVTLTWTAPVGATAIGYILDVGTASGTSNVITLPTGTTSNVFSATAPNGNYYVRVRAVYASGTSGPSNEFLLQVGCTAPAPQPTALRVQLTGATVTLTWVPPSGAVERQVIEAGSATGLTNLASVTLPPRQSSFTATAPNGTYYVRARAANSCGTSAPSSEVFFTVGAGVALPDAPTGLVGHVTGRNVSISWTAPTGAITGYLLEYGSGDGLTLASIPLGSATVFAANNVPVGTFYLRVRAVNAAGLGPPTADAVLVVQ